MSALLQLSCIYDMLPPDMAGQGESDVRQMLRRAGLRCTAGRQKVLAILMKARRPLSHAEVMQRLGKDKVDRVSVYRALHALVDAGLVHRALVHGRTALYETADRCTEQFCHPHFVCRRCGVTLCIAGTLNYPRAELGRGFVVERQRLLLEGLCPKCARS